MFPSLGASGKLDIFLQHYFDAHGFFYYLHDRVIDATIEFTSKFAGKVYPYARIKHRKYIKSPENLTKSVRLSGLFFLPREVYSRGLHGITTQHGKVANL